ncbi:hypothetical protein [Pseudomonas sp. ACN5]|uniref:hypothetical protein n=1 Tax=Pseudomonas sp. ACN5 TaxID=1920427 RepID=UPI003531D1D7
MTYHYHYQSPVAHRTVVVDIGGGTTDIALRDVASLKQHGECQKAAQMSTWGFRFEQSCRNLVRP